MFLRGIFKVLIIKIVNTMIKVSTSSSSGEHNDRHNCKGARFAPAEKLKAVGSAHESAPPRPPEMLGY